MQARRKQKGIRKRTARAGAARRRKKRWAALLCGLLLCGAAAVIPLRACARQAAPAGCSLQSLMPEKTLAFPLGGLGAGAWRVSSGYGWRAEPLEGEEEEFHKGVDLACAEGTPVLAALDGVVLVAKRSGSYGNYIRLCHDGNVETLYAHLQYLYVRPGEVVRAGQALGTAGQTGRVTGPHLHFELWYRALRYDPSKALGLTEGGG